MARISLTTDFAKFNGSSYRFASSLHNIDQARIREIFRIALLTLYFLLDGHVGGGTRGGVRGSRGGADAKVAATQLSQRVVKTQYGKVRGLLVVLPTPIRTSAVGTGIGATPRLVPLQVEAYIGLEYASLLGGDLRFMPPTSPVTKWDGVRYAHKFKPVCPQKPLDLTELQKRLPTEKFEHLRRLVPFLEIQHEDCLNLNVYAPVEGLHYIL